MNEQLQGQLASILGLIQTSISEVGDFASEQLPDIVSSYVLYGRVWNSVIVLIFAIVGVFTVKFVWYNPKDKGTDWRIKDALLLTRLFGSMAIIGIFLGFFAQLGPLLLVWLSPKVWLLTEFAHMIK